MGLTRIYVFILLVIASQVFADPVSKGHGHKTPHGGILQEAEGMHAEFMIDKSGEPKLYLYDKGMKPLGRGDLQAKLTLKGHDGSQHVRDLKMSGNPKEGNVFKGDPIKGPADWDTAVVSVKLKERWTHFRFSPHAHDSKAGH